MNNAKRMTKGKIALVACLGAVALVTLGLIGAKLASPEGKKPSGRLFVDPTFHYEALRVLGYSSTGGADINEVLHTVAKIPQGDNEAWAREWYATGERVERLANTYSDPASASFAMGRASNYYRAAEFFMQAKDPRKIDISRKTVSAFRKHLDMGGVVYREFQVPYGDSSLDAVYYPAKDPGDRPLIVCVDGYDSIKEELYFLGAKACLERGYSVVTFDGPGQGTAIREKGIKMTPDWIVPMRSLLDEFTARFGAPSRVVLLGNSFGSILSLRAAAFEPRIAGVACFDIFYDYAEVAYGDFPENLKAQIDGKKPMSERAIALSDSVILSDWFRAISPKIAWAMKQGMFIFGVKGPFEVLREYRKYTIVDIADRVKCDVLLLAGTEDHLIPYRLLEPHRKALTNARSVTVHSYDRESGGQEHCQVGANSLWQADFFDWLAERFGEAGGIE